MGRIQSDVFNSIIGHTPQRIAIDWIVILVIILNLPAYIHGCLQHM